MKRLCSVLLAVVLLCSGIPTVTFAQGTGTSGAQRKVAHTLYVSTDGRDNGDGTEQNPFQTIEQARDAVRTLDKTKGDIVVKIAGGTYYLDNTIAFTEADSGNENCTIYYEAVDGERPVISGGEKVTGDWRDEGDGTYSIPYERDIKLRSLYVNGERAYMTQRDSQGRGDYGSYTVDSSKDWAWISGTRAAGTQLDAGAIPLDTRNQDDIELMTQTTWNTAIVCVDKLQDIGNGRISANYQMPYGAVAQQPSWNNNYKSGGWQMMYNVFEWLPGAKGHFYFDKTEKRLYYCPRDGEDMNDLEVIAPKLETLIDLSGSSTTSRIGYITFSGLEFAHSDWNLYELEGSYGRVTVQGAAGLIYFADGNWHPSIYRAYDVGPGAVMVNSAQHIAFYGNTICHTGNDGLSFVNDVVDSTVSGNLIYDTAGSAFLLGHPQHVYIGDKGSNYGAFSEKEKYDVGVEGACKRIKLTNNFISDTSLMFWGDAGVMVFLAEEFEMKYNHLQNTPYSGLSLGWGWWNMDGSNGAVVPGVPMETTKNNTIMYNTFKNTITKLGDAGAIYTLGDMPGTKISENYIWSIGTPGIDPYHIRGIHVDEGTKHVYGEKNVIEILPKLTCVDCGNWGWKGNNTWDNNYATTESYTTTGTWEPGTVVTNAHTSLEGIWGTEVFDILKNVGIQSDYYSIIPESMFGLQDRLLPNKIYAARQELDWGTAAQNIKGEIWLAPEGTEEFVESDAVVQVKDGKVVVPDVNGIYKLYIVNGTEVSAPSSGQIIVEAGAPIRNAAEGERKKTSTQKPFALELNTKYYKDFVLRKAEAPDIPGENVTDGYKITEAGSYILQAKDLNNLKAEVSFEVYENLVDQVFSKNIQSKPGNSVRLDTTGMDGETAWFVPEGMEINKVSQLTESEQMTKAESGASEIAAPRAVGNYQMYLVMDDVISEPSDAVLTVFMGGLPITDGLLARFDAEDIENGDGKAVSEWQDSTKQYSLVQTEAGRQPIIQNTENDMAYLSFDGSDDYLQLKEDQEIDLNQKSNLTIITLSAYKETDPPTGTYGDEKTTVFFPESGSWGSLYMSNYAGFMVSRFGSGQSNNYNKYMRPAATSRFTTAAMVKDGKTEYMYDDGEKVYTNTDRYEQTNNLQKSMMVGVTKASNKDSYANIEVSEILIYDRSLSDDEIEKIYNYTSRKQYLKSLEAQMEAAEEVFADPDAETKYSEASRNNLKHVYNGAMEFAANFTTAIENPEAAAAEWTNKLTNAINALVPPVTTVPSEGLALWLKADEGITLDEDGGVSVWNDYSGLGRNAVKAQNAQPNETVTSPKVIEDLYNGKPAVRFNGSSDGMQFPFAGLNNQSEATVVLVSANQVKTDVVGTGDNRPLLCFDESGGWGKFIITPTQDEVNARIGSGQESDKGGYKKYTYPESIGNRLSASVVWKNGSEETIYVGDQEVMRVTDAQSTIKNVKDDIGYLGRFPTGGDSAYWYNQSDVAEVLIYNRALTLAEIQQINSYLEDKYQISAQVVLESITVTPPANTVYTVGEELDLTGMEVTARYTDGSIKAITEGFKVTGYDKDRPGEQTITISYTEQGLEKTATFTVTVRSAVEPEVLESITVTPPAKTAYIVGEELELTGMEVTARYTDGSTKVITKGYTVTGYDKDVPGEQTITISYTEQGVEKTAAFTVTVRSTVDPEVTNVEGLISQIGAVAYNNTTKAKIEAAENAYKKLTPQQQALVSNYDALKSARANYDALKADAEKRAADQEAADRVSSLISGIGTVSAGSKAKIDAAEKAYNALTADQKKLVKNYSVLTSAKEAYQKITALPRKGAKFLVGNLWYQVTRSDVKNGTVTVVKAKNKNYKSINIKSTVKIKGYTFKITAIGKKAFYKNRGLTSIKVGKNIVKIDSYAFYGCTKLKSVRIYSTKLKTVGKNAFGKTAKNIEVRVPKNPKKLLKKYQNLLKKGGSKKAKYKR